MADNTNLNAAVNGIGRFSSDYSNSSKSANAAFRSLTNLASNLGQTSKDIFSAVKDSGENLVKYNKAIESASKTISSLAGNSTKLGFSIGAATKIASAGLTSFLEVTDNILKLNDTLAEYGVGVENSSMDIIGIANGAGYWSANAMGFAKLVGDTGSSLLALEPTTGKAAKRFKQIFNVSQIQGGVEGIVKLGYTPATFNKAQQEYIKLQSAYGLKLSASDEKVRQGSMEYVLTITKLSALTGDSRDAISQQLASQALDFKYQATMRELTLQGNTEAVKQFETATTLINSQLGPDALKGINDMIANGTATTKEGEGVMLATQNQAAGWAEQVKKGQMSGVEYARNVAKAYGDFIQTNKQALRVSENFRRQVGITGKTLTGIDLAVGMADDATVDKLLKQSQNAEDDKKGNQARLLEIERNKGIAMDQLAISMSGGILDAFKTFTNLVRRIALGSAGLGKAIAPEGSEAEKAFQKVQDILGTADDAKQSLAKVNSDLKENEEAIKKHGKYTEDYLKYSDEYNKAVAKKNELLKAKEKGQTIDEKALQDYMKQESESWKQITAILSREKKMFGGVTSQTLLYRKKELIERKQELETTVKVKVEDETKEVETEKARKRAKEALEKQRKEEREGSTAESEKIDFASISTKNGLTAKVNSKVADRFQKLINWLEDKGYAINSLGGFVDRDVRGQGGVKSQHAYGAAIDINPNENPMGSKLITDMPKGINEFANSIGLGWGGNWSSKKDAMHFSAAKHEQGAGYSKGGISSGPKSGYKVELHGTEAIIPMMDGKTIPIELKIPDKKDDFSFAKQDITYRMNMLKSIKVPNFNSNQPVESYDDSAEFDLVNTLLDKIQLMITQFENSNSIQSNLKVYLHN